MGNAGGFNTVNTSTLTFDDAAPGNLPFSSAPVTGSYKPTSFVPLPPFPAPAPVGTYSTALSAFNDSNPNGLWSLFIIDDTSPGAGVVSNGWSLAITRNSSIPSAADLSLGMTATTGIAGSPLTYTLRLTNNGPATATSISVADTLPAGVTFVSASPTTGTTTNASGIVTWSVPSLANGATATLSLIVTPSSVGILTNTATATAAVTDLFAQNNTASLVTTVVVPSADLVVGMNDSPDPVGVGSPLTYQITVTNLGPATASSVVVTNPLPAGVNFGSVTTSQGGSGLSGTNVTASLGSISAGGTASMTLVVIPTQPGFITNTATASMPASIIDPLKASNTASVKTTVTGPQTLGARASGAVFTLTTSGLEGYVLDSTPSLAAPVIWTPLMTNPPAEVNLPIVPTGSQFFRLRVGP